MVRIINFKEREKQDGTTFCLLELQGGIKMILSEKTGQYYASAKKAFITSTFDAETCKALIGTEMPGSILKQDSEPYTFTIKETGEQIILTHRWVYSPSESSVNPTKEDQAVSELLNSNPSFSKNGVKELEEQFM